MKLKVIRVLFTPLTLVIIVLWGLAEGVLQVRGAAQAVLRRSRR